LRNAPATDIRRAEQLGVSFLASKQAQDGAWRSELYGTFKDGTALTPLVLHALLLNDPKNPAVAKAAGYLAGMIEAAGDIRPLEAHGFDYPLYTSALSAAALSQPQLAEHITARDAWLNDLRKRQLTESLGWIPDDREYGGWGYCHGWPRKRNTGELIPPMTESNLSATTFALAAFKAAGVRLTDPHYAKALVFVKRCQNWTDAEAHREPRFDDGGFFFIYDDPIRNKAGVVGKDARGQDRYASYGSTTADGLRCLDMCGEKMESPRFAAASAWLEKNFLPDRCPGPFDPRAEVARAALYYYYAMSMSQVPLEAKPGAASAANGGGWRGELARAITARQKADGSWVNPADAFRENDALVATSFACIALAHCGTA
jgi:squalene-hopene/tetraprenyl-beta-curcumene cyclase